MASGSRWILVLQAVEVLPCVVCIHLEIECQIVEVLEFNYIRFGPLLHSFAQQQFSQRMLKNSCSLMCSGTMSRNQNPTATLARIAEIINMPFSFVLEVSSSSSSSAIACSRHDLPQRSSVLRPTIIRFNEYIFLIGGSESNPSPANLINPGHMVVRRKTGSWLIHLFALFLILDLHIAYLLAWLRLMLDHLCLESRRECFWRNSMPEPTQLSHKETSEHGQKPKGQ